MAASASNDSTPPGDGADNPILCVICSEPFQRNTDCLVHELLEHESLPQKGLRQRLNPSGSQLSQSERYELRDALDKSKRGAPLLEVLQFFAADLSKMELCFDYVSSYIEQSMKGLVVVTSFGSLASDLAVKGKWLPLSCKWRPIRFPFAFPRKRHRFVFRGLQRAATQEAVRPG